MPRLANYRLAPIALAAVLLCSSAHAQEIPHFADPANLAGERPEPRTGRELPIDTGSRGLAQLLRRLSTRASVMNIVAHPDDEDGGMLTVYSRGLGARVADLSLTRGEGGQNAMTGDFEDALGLLRTQELLSNDRFVGVTQLFGTEVDFGFSKTKSEAFSKWTHDRVLYDVVRAIRIYRPLVLTSTWIGAATDGHGQHQVAGQIAQEAFLAAGDPNVFPELTREGILPWQPLKIYARVPMSSITPRGLYDYATGQYVPAEFHNYVTGALTSAPPTSDITVHEGSVDPILSAPAEGPVSYIQFARRGLSEQRSQMGPGGRSAPVGDFDVQYHLFGSCLEKDSASLSVSPLICHFAPNAVSRTQSDSEQPSIASADPNFFEGMDTSVASLSSLAPDAPASLRQGLQALSSLIAQAQSSFDPSQPEKLAPRLADALQTANELLASLDASSLPESEKYDLLHELRIKQTQLNDALVLALGLSFDATTPEENVVALSTTPVYFKLHEAASVPLTVQHESVQNEYGNTFSIPDLDEERASLSVDHPIERNVKIDSQITGDITRPYFTRESIETPVYTLTEPAFRNAASSPPALVAQASVDYRGVSITLSRVVHAGQQAASIVPPAILSFPLHAQVLPRTEHSLDLTLGTQALAPEAQNRSAVLVLPTRWEADRSLAPLNRPSTTFHISFSPGALQHTESITAKAVFPNAHIIEGFRPVGYGDLPRINFYTPASDRIVPVDIKLPTRRRIAYLPGTGDAVPEALSSIGLPVTTLTVDDLTADKLAGFDTVILGVRTYAAHSDLHGAPTTALLDFARNGGNVVVQYQTTEFTAADAPYPLNLGSEEKVVDETAPVSLLDARAILLNTPNKITSADFNGWVEERGHGFLSTWDSHYTALTETHDPGAPSEHVAPQAPQRGGLITVSLGKGRWTYCAFALYRQLPEAVPGAFRLFANLITP